MPCGHLLERVDLLAGSRLWCLTVSLSLSHGYPGSGVVLYCIDSGSLYPYLLSCSYAHIDRVCIIDYEDDDQN